MNKFKIISTLLLVFTLQLFFAQKEVKKPQEAFDILIKSFVKDDKAAQKSLNDYMRPTVQGQDMYQFSTTSNEEQVNLMVENFSANFPKSLVKTNAADIKLYMELLMGNFRNAEYKVKSAKLVDNEYQEGEKIAEIKYDITFKVPQKLSEAQIKEAEKLQTKNAKPEDMKKILAIMIDSLKNASVSVTQEQNFSLYQMKEGDKIFYFNGSPDQLVSDNIDFYLDNINFSDPK
ncbi:hypothetical protein [Chryseobacterium sp.]|uniref:hypothetical protein n=1 Tax=Chryseobacterium sp. TaxID=1871047 RepID=UPI00388D2365